jgi:hypothetical protein
MGGVSSISAVVVAGSLILFVWLKIVRPVRGDLAWARQAERIERAKARRLARRLRAMDTGHGKASSAAGRSSGSG